MRVEIKGLREFKKAVAAADPALKKEVRLALNEASNKVVESTRFVSVTGRAATTLRAASTQRAARVRVGGSKAPYAPWLDFGGRVGRNRSIHRPYKKEGRYVYPAYRRLRDSGEFQAVMTEALVRVGDKAGLEVEPQ